MRYLCVDNEQFDGPPNNNSNGGCNTTKFTDVNNSAAREIMDLRKLLKDVFDKKKVFCSFELFPTRINADIYQRFFTETRKYSPLFYALTWHHRDKCDNNKYIPLELIHQFPQNTLLHLSGRGLGSEDVEYILSKALSSRITNIFVLRGDNLSSSNIEFSYAVDLVKFIKARFGDTFSICVAGYPEMHPESASKEEDLLHLKAKVDAGADCIITQIVFDAKTLINFVNDCREIGIKVPIIPGIFPIPDFTCLKKMANICKIKIPKKILDDLSPIQHDNQAVHNYGVDLAVHIIRDILDSNVTNGFHLFALNRISLATEVCDKLRIFNVQSTEYKQ